MKTLILPAFVLQDATVTDAVTKWKEDVLAATGGDHKIYASLRSSSYLRDVRLTLNLSQVSAADAITAIILEINAKADRAEVTLDRWTHVEDRMVAVYYSVERISRSLARARSIQLPAFEIRRETFMEAVETWSKLAKRHDPEKDGLSWTATGIRDKMALEERYDVQVPSTDAATAIQLICDATNASLEWGVTEFRVTSSISFDLKLMMFEAKPELRQHHDWSNADGTKTIQARFIKLENGKVSLLVRGNSQTVEVPLESLSPDSRKQAEDLSRLRR
jgi:hypothetical protein